MKYDKVELGGSGRDASRVLVRRLVGTGKRVLDVGCSTGDVAAALAEDGNLVSGIESDPEAAEKARPYLTQLVVADLDAANLASQFEPGSFDVVVLANVLHRLVDPAATLLQARALLTEGGSAVISVCDDRTPTGLSDEVQLPWSAIDRLERLARDAGLSVTDRQWTPESEGHTSQVVLKVAPTERVVPDDSRIARNHVEELWTTRAQLRRIAASLTGIDPLPSVAVVGGDRDGIAHSLDQIRQAVVLGELRRRIVGVEFRAVNLTERPLPSSVTGEPLWPLTTADGASSGLLRESCAVVVAAESLEPADQAILETQAPEAIWVRRRSENQSDVFEADAVMLGSRILDKQLLAARGRYLRQSSVVPRDGRIALVDLAEEEAEPQLADTMSRAGLTLQRLAHSTAPLDLAATVASAHLVITDCRALAMLAMGLERPVVMTAKMAGVPRWIYDPGAGGDYRQSLTEVLGDLTPVSADTLRTLRLSLDAQFDDLAAQVVSASGEAMAQTADYRIHGLAHRVAVLEAVNAGLRRMMDKERRTLLHALGSGRGPLPPATATQATTQSVFSKLAAAEEDIARLRDQVHHLQEEIDRVYATRVMRTARPARSAYARFRRFLR